MKLTRQNWMLIISLIVVALIIWEAWDFFYTRPLDTPLSELATRSAGGQPVGKTAQPAQYDPIGLPTPLPSPENYTQPAGITSIPRPAVDSNAKTVCGGPPLLFVLVTGNDEHNLADSIRIVRVDFTKQDMSVLAIQRATWVSIPNLDAHNIDAGLINSAHSYGNYFLGPGGGISLLAQTISLNLGIGIDRYVDVNYAAFIKAVDAVGGMEVYLEQPLDSTLQGLGVYFKAGWQHMDGETALKYVRIRFPDSDWNRIARQTEFGRGLYQKLTTPAMLPRLPGLMASVREDVATDLSPEEMSAILCLVNKVKTNEIRFYEIGQDMVTPTTLKDKNRSQIMLPKWDRIRPFVQEFILGTLK
jgi:LCP family protein required for cell wall assembly